LSLKKYALWVLALAVCISGAVLFGCTQIANNNSVKLGVAENNEEVTTKAEEQIVLAEVADAAISVTGIEQKNNDLVTPLTVHIGNTSKTYPWENVSNPTYYPELIVADLDSDSESEVYLFLVKGYGTGILNTEAHIMNKDFTEIVTPNPTKDLKSNLSSTVVERDGQQVYTIQFDNTKYRFAFPMDAAAMWFEEAALGKITKYRIENNRLIVSQSLQVSPGLFVANIDTSYRLVQGQFKHEKSVFIEIPQETEGEEAQGQGDNKEK